MRLSRDTLYIHYGKFAETAGIGVGDEVTIALREKGGELAAQLSLICWPKQPESTA